MSKNLLNKNPTNFFVGNLKKVYRLNIQRPITSSLFKPK